MNGRVKSGRESGGGDTIDGSMDGWTAGGWPGERQDAGSEAGTAACLDGGREGRRAGWEEEAGAGGRCRGTAGAGRAAHMCGAGPPPAPPAPVLPVPPGAERSPARARRGRPRMGTEPRRQPPPRWESGGTVWPGRGAGRGRHRARGKRGGGLRTSRARGGGAPLYSQGVRETRGLGRWCPAGLCRLRRARCKWGNRRGTETGVMRASRLTGGFLLNPPAGVITRAGGFSCSLGWGPPHCISLGVPLQPMPGQEEPVSPRGWGRSGRRDSFQDSVFAFHRVAPRSCCSGPGVRLCPPQGTTLPWRGPRGLSGPRPQFWQG